MGARPPRQSAFNDSATASSWLQPLAARVGQWIGANSPARRPAADEDASPRRRSTRASAAQPSEDAGPSTLMAHRMSELKATREELSVLLHQHPKARRVVPHLAHVAIRLRDADLSVLQTLRPDVAARAFQQLSTLAGDCAGRPGLRALRKRLLIASQPAASAGPVTSMSAFGRSSELGLGHELLVEEGSLDAFEQEERAWSDTHEPGVLDSTR